MHPAEAVLEPEAVARPVMVAHLPEYPAVAAIRDLDTSRHYPRAIEVDAAEPPPVVDFDPIPEPMPPMASQWVY